jgi:multidrug resistance efflux pump
MTTLILLSYAALCFVVFRFLPIPRNEWTIASAVFGGIVFVAGLILVLDYNQPFTEEARVAFRTTPIFTTVEGRVIEVAARPNTPLKRGDVLFKLDPAPFQHRLDEAKAQLAAGEQSARELQASLEAAEAQAAQAKTIRDNAKDVADSYAKANTEGEAKGGVSPFSRLDVADKRAAYLEAEATYTAAQAAADKAELAVNSQIGGINTDVARLEAAAEQAEFQLAQATVVAPSDGYVTQLALEPGMVSMPMPIRPVMVFVHTGAGQMPFVASFDQSVTQRINPGNAAEIVFDAIPGQVFNGRVTQLLDTIAQGQMSPSGDLVAPESREVTRGRISALIEITDDLSSYQLPAGASAEVAVYTEHFKEVGLIRQLLLRMKGWANFVVLPANS